jgi:hypothetical protein
MQLALPGAMIMRLMASMLICHTDVDLHSDVGMR